MDADFVIFVVQTPTCLLGHQPTHMIQQVMRIHNLSPNNVYLTLNKNARRPKEVHIAQNLKEIKILDRAEKDMKELDQYN